MKKIFLILIAFAITFSGCKKYFDINTDPATPQDPDSKTLTPPLFAQMERGIQFDARYLGGLVQYFGGAVNVGETHGWLVNSDAMGEIWRTNYYGLGANLNLIIQDSEKKQEYNYVGLAQALKAWGWQITTDYHGDIILKQAYEPNRFVFDYDPQQDVYAEVVRLANESIKSFSRTDGTGTPAKMAGYDLAYNGDAAKWIKFNYGLLARNANNLINKTTYNADKVIEYADKALASNADNFIVPNTGSTAVNGNFFGPLRANLGAYRQTRIIVGLLDGTYFTGTAGAVVDPRRNNMITASVDLVFRGTNPGSVDGGTVAGKNQIPNVFGVLGGVTPAAGQGKYLFKDNAGFPIMTFAEMQFIKAEAAFRSGKLEMALAAYQNGISASIDFVSALGTVITPAEKTAYMTSASVRQTAATLTLKDIMLQKYLALYGYGFVETWCDLRKYHYNVGDSNGNNPYLNAYVFPGSFFVDNGGKPAQRYRPRYNSEYLWNVAALKKIGADKNDYHTVKMWFSEP
ncbi:SusD/RagB family nutrient-binding outer membrane lipoprotein [Pedobacter frigiditerrae]|uniref:SusD/RagB family nutrient-binding outer membrane lipoprotein n=1 Tax=Pedobacter frigiditerrae TaxID=2530452 RepID=A0A4R0N2F5_9SPHI|nr:SusD/RagB family nutrient-binding outer membrane lipoprotein [Pedobacter frigiditerrae]TCC94018.1 SusD/RagB family nutrient-binding outer membrane lipoprotein [Pedobacter frigiditerrae]